MTEMIMVAMFCIVGVFVFLIVGGIVVQNMSKRNKVSPHAREILERFQSQFGGEIRSVGGSPSLLMQRHGFEASIDLGWGNQGGFHFTAKPHGLWGGHAQVCPEGFGAAITNFFGTRDIVVGDRDFDALYEVRGEPPEFIRDLLAEDTRMLLRNLGRRGDLLLTITPKLLKLRLRAMTMGRDDFDNAMDALISSGLQIAEGLPRSESGEKITLVDTSLAVEETACQVCGTALSGEIVECTKCATLHHRDCWTFTERCSTYACGSISSRKAVMRA